jgi:hypothetical protein
MLRNSAECAGARGQGDQVKEAQRQNQIKQPSRWKNFRSPALRQADALAKLLIEKGLITQEEFMQKISEERATYQAIFIPLHAEDWLFSF